MNKIRLACCIALCGLPAWAKDPNQAMADMQAVSDTDPNGFKWMLVCIGFLFVLAGSLIVATIIYGMKQKEKQQIRSAARNTGNSESGQVSDERSEELADEHSVEH